MMPELACAGGVQWECPPLVPLLWVHNGLGGGDGGQQEDVVVDLGHLLVKVTCWEGRREGISELYGCPPCATLCVCIMSRRFEMSHLSNVAPAQHGQH